LETCWKRFLLLAVDAIISTKRKKSRLLDDLIRKLDKTGSVEELQLGIVVVHALHTHTKPPRSFPCSTRRSTIACENFADRSG